MTSFLFARSNRTRAIIILAMFASVATACESRERVADRAPSVTENLPSVPADNERSPVAADPMAALAARLVAIDGAVGRWRTAPDLRSAHAAAEEARNLVVGPAGPYYGDADQDGATEGASNIGLLPGLAGQAALTQSGQGACIDRDILGGSWEKPAQRWSILAAAIKAWSPSNNTFPTLPSHPQRIIGWATLTLSSKRLASAREYAGHAQLHVDVARAALTACKG